MARSVVGVFEDRGRAERAVDDLQRNGFRKDELSVVTRDGEQRGREGRGREEGEETAFGPTVAAGWGDEEVGEGLAWGGALGGLGGLLAGAGAIAIPGIGPIIAAGPIAAALSGAVTGGLAGGLLDFGIPEERGRFFEQRVKEGKILALVKTDDENRVEDAARIMRDNGARDVETHSG